MARVMLVSSGLLLAVFGSVLGKTRSNWFFGVRTPWTLSSKTAWVKTHRAGGWTFLAVGLAQIATALVLPPFPATTVMLVLVLGASLGLTAYSYFVWREADDKTPPAGTLPA